MGHEATADTPLYDLYAVQATSLCFGFGLQSVGMGATDRYLLDRSFAPRSQESWGRRAPSTSAEPEQLPGPLASPASPYPQGRALPEKEERFEYPPAYPLRGHRCVQGRPGCCPPPDGETLPRLQRRGGDRRAPRPLRRS